MMLSEKQKRAIGNRKQLKEGTMKSLERLQQEAWLEFQRNGGDARDNLKGVDAAAAHIYRVLTSEPMSIDKKTWDGIVHDAPGLEAVRERLNRYFAEHTLPAKADNLGVHLSHCNFGENVGVCKYGDDDCPALSESWRWLGQMIESKKKSEPTATPFVYEEVQSVQDGELVERMIRAWSAERNLVVCVSPENIRAMAAALAVARPAILAEVLAEIKIGEWGEIGRTDPPRSNGLERANRLLADRLRRLTQPPEPADPRVGAVAGILRDPRLFDGGSLTKAAERVLAAADRAQTEARNEP